MTPKLAIMPDLKSPDWAVPAPVRVRVSPYDDSYFPPAPKLFKGQQQAILEQWYEDFKLAIAQVANNGITVKAVLNTKETAFRLGVSPTTVWKLKNLPKSNPLKLNQCSHGKYSVVELDRHLAVATKNAE